VKRRISPARLLLAGAAWRSLGTRRSGEMLLEAMSGDDEQNLMLAGMALIKAGERTVELIEERVDAGEASVPAIGLLPDIGSPRARALLERIANESSGEEAIAASRGLDQLERSSAAISNQD
jgi:hypothetical protein